MSVDTINDFALLCLGVWGDGETWAYGGLSSLGSRCSGRSGDDGFGVGRIDRDGGWVHERDGGGTELCLGRDDLDVVAEDVDGR